ncbi:nucleotidyltransferase [Litchfieldia salsa]|uniref:tRNA(Met) cytidine acetate ligase n=1 Tax=Litchfieldia salsa TaxID=930152 RepID=A0A1H0RH15_9BACI|nr:nucleotidyltransferase [Litchfieldia salsa]SDP28306.1 Predicted nucleotidyltransferase [Litchfieldia salsa]
MKAVGVVVEYNPFHNGHEYHLRQSKSQTGADLVVAVMSGNFLQRGEPALVSKWSRTKMALENGIDLVVELPYEYATQKAETFSNGAIAILDKLKCSYLCFGSEHGSIQSFNNTLNLIQKNSKRFNEIIRTEMKKGISYPMATSLAYHSLNPESAYINLSTPNNILGFHYLKAIDEQNSKMQPHTIQRTSANYHDEDFTSSTIASATSIRKALFEQNRNLFIVQDYIPHTTFKELEKYIETYGQLHRWEDYFNLLKYKVLTSSHEELSNIYEIEEGLEYRFKREIIGATSFNEFMENVKTKRYTRTRLQRACLHILTNSRKSVIKPDDNDWNKPTYIRLLGMSKIGQSYLRSIKKEIDIPLISKLSSFNQNRIQLDINATYTYSMVLPEAIRSQFIKEEFSTPPLRYDEDKEKYL